MRHGKSLTPGSVYRQFTFSGPWNTIDCPFTGWQRVTDPASPHPGARKYLPNQINEIWIDDLDGATAAEMVVEEWGGHAGTSRKTIRVNDGEPLLIEEPVTIGPGPSEAYQYFRYPVLPVPLEILRPGRNIFAVSSGPQIAHDMGWGQWGIYGVSIRVYYTGDKARHGGSIVAEARNHKVHLRADAYVESGSIDRVDFVGRYDDFDHHGEGEWIDWHYRLRYGRLADHIGAASSYPHRLVWDTRWLPAQSGTVSIIGIVTDYTGLRVVTDPVTLESGTVGSVSMVRPTGVPEAWQTRAGTTQSCTLTLDMPPDRVAAARVALASWNGYECDEIAINGRRLVERVGRDHDYSLDEIEVPIACLIRGENVFSTCSKTEAHGIEVLWPGPALKVMPK